MEGRSSCVSGNRKRGRLPRPSWRLLELVMPGGCLGLLIFGLPTVWDRLEKKFRFFKVGLDIFNPDDEFPFLNQLDPLVK